MKMSLKNRDAAYAAIHGAVGECRVALRRDGLTEQQEAMLATLPNDLWRRIKAALKLDGES